jgi:peptide/nickel transport system ATP-binding protein
VSAAAGAAPSVLEGAGLVKEFGGRGQGSVLALDGVDVSLAQGEFVAVVGESGSGKSTLGRVLMALLPPTEGQVRLNGRPVEPRTNRDRLDYWRTVQLVFQDPFGCLNPTKTIGQLLSRPFRNFFGRSRSAAQRDVIELLESVNLSPGTSFLHRYPHELSGGQRQRVVLARALAVEPSFIVADEPVSMLDVSVRAGILALMDSIRRDRDVGFLYITHDLVSAYQVADRIVVMYGGRVMEEGTAQDVVTSPQHPYTRLLLSAVPGSAQAKGQGPAAPAAARAAPAAADARQGCRFAGRCPLAMDVCWSTVPPLVNISARHVAWCHAVRPVPAEGPSGARA